MEQNPNPGQLTHLDEHGAARMVDVGAKPVTDREAAAEGVLAMAPETRRILFAGEAPKGDALAAARIAGIMAAKRTAELIPLCHPLAPSSLTVTITEDPAGARVRCAVRVADRTGAEMEALTGTTVALLTLYDMLKAVQKDMEINAVRVVRKSGGKSDWG